MGEPPKIEKIPALVFSSKNAGLKIATLTVLDRLVVAMARGGVGPITILTEDPVPELKRTKGLGISVQVVNTVSRIEGRVLVAEANVLVQAADVKRCLETGGRLVQREALLPLGVVKDGGSIEGRLCAVDRPSDSVERLLAGTPRIEASGVARLITAAGEAKSAERELWATMTSSADGLVDRVFNRPSGRFLSKVLINTPVTPNIVSIASILTGVIAALFLAEGSYRSALIGAILFQLSAIVDCVDGEIARILFKESPLGRWIDLAGDQIVHISVFAGIAFGVLRNGGGKETVWLGLSAVLGALISFAVVVRGMRRPAGANGPLQKLIDAATNRDFSVIVLALAFAQNLPLFLWLAGVGSHLFWITALALQLDSRRGKAAADQP